MNSHDDLLHGQSDESARLRDALLLKTLSVVRRRRRVRQFTHVAMFAGCFVAGMLTMRGLQLPPPTPSVETMVVNVPIKMGPPSVKSVAQPSKTSPYEHLRRDGDRDWNDPRRMKNAVYRYSRAVALASREQRAIDPEKDSWLLMALKLDQQSNQETRHERE